MSTPLNTAALKPVYLLASGEPLLLRDWLDASRAALREAGFEDILNLPADSGFDWRELLDEGDMMSLFSSRKCRIVTMPSARPGQQGARVISELCDNPAEDAVYIFVTPALDRQTRNAAWCKKVQAVGEVIELKPVYDNQLADWLLERARQKGLEIDLQSAQFLAERTEGNLLAADQELEKLSIRFAGRERVDFDSIETSVAQSARYSHFLLVDACLAGKPRRALKILKSLRAEGYATAQLRWGLQQVLQQLDELLRARGSGRLNEQCWQRLRIWRNKQRLYQAAMARLDATRVERLLQSCAKLDRLGKGQQDSAFPEPDWFEIELLVAALSGKSGTGYESSFLR